MTFDTDIGKILTLLSLMFLANTELSGQDQTPQPTWELNEKSVNPEMTQGVVTVADGTVILDGTNLLSVPSSFLGQQNDYTIEFSVKRPIETRRGETFNLVSNTDKKNKTGLGLVYHPPDYNAALLFVNDYKTAEQKGFLSEKFEKVTLVVKDRNLSLFRNGLILAMTSEVKPSLQPLSFGAIENRPTQPYEIKDIKIYDTAIFPTGFDKSAERMRSFSGEGYFMQRAEVKDHSLPRILIVGDSISMGYRGFIAEHFKGKAYVDYWVGGGWFGETARGPDSPAKRSWDGVLSNGPYDVVSWNAMTLHMWNGVPGRCNEATYPANMTEMVEHLQKAAPHTKFIWVRCTPVRTTPATGRPTIDPSKNDLVVRLNKVTDQIMTAHGIPNVDLYSLCEKRMDTVPAGSKDALHWDKEVAREMADEIIKKIETSLLEKQSVK